MFALILIIQDIKDLPTDLELNKVELISKSDFSKVNEHFECIPNNFRMVKSVETERFLPYICCCSREN